MLTLIFTNNGGGSRTIVAASNGFSFTFYTDTQKIALTEWSGKMYCPHCMEVSDVCCGPYYDLGEVAIEEFNAMLIDEMFLHGEGKCCDA